MSNNSLVWHKELRAGRHEDLHLQVGSLEQPCAAERAAGGMAGPCANKHIFKGHNAEYTGDTSQSPLKVNVFTAGRHYLKFCGEGRFAKL